MTNSRKQAGWPPIAEINSRPLTSLYPGVAIADQAKISSKGNAAWKRLWVGVNSPNRSINDKNTWNSKNSKRKSNNGNNGTSSSAGSIDITVFGLRASW